MISRREWLGTSIGAGAALALSPQLLRALESLEGQGGKLMQRAIPSSGEMLPVISFAPRPTGPVGPGEIKPAPTDVPVAKEILKTFLDNGGKVVDVLHGGPIGEDAARTAARQLGIQDKFFWTTPLTVAMTPVLPGYAGPPLRTTEAAVKKAMEAKLAELKVSKIDLVMVGAGIDAPLFIRVLKDMKKDGRVRYIGVHDLATPPFPPTAAFNRLEALMRNEPIDFVGTDYAVGWRGVEEKLLPLALERKIGFMAYFPFDRGRIFKRIGTTPLPEWAAEFDAKTWAQFCLKYVLSHPAVIVAREGTTNAAHMLDNIGGGIGRLPDEAMRKRMAAFVDALPPTPAPAPVQPQQQSSSQAAPVVLSAAIMDRYVGEYWYAASNQSVTVRRSGDRLLMKVQGNMPEGPLFPRSETLFGLQIPGITIQFQLDGQGKVTGALWEMGPYRMQLERK